MSKKTKGKAKEERAGSYVSAGLVFGDVKCVTFELVGDFFRLRLMFRPRRCSLMLHVLLYVVRINKPTPPPPRWLAALK